MPSSSLCEDVPIFVEVKEHMMNEIQEIKRAKDDPSFDEEIWINTVPTFYENQKEDLLLTDKSGIQWVALSKYADTGKVDLAYNKLLIWNWLYGYFVTDEQLVTLKKYADKKVNLINSDIRWIPETYTIYNREYPWSSGSKSIEELQWENIKVETGEMKSIIETVEEPQFSYAEILQKKYLGEFDEDKKWDELGTALDEKISIPVVCKKYTREEPMTVGLGRVLNSCQDLIWEEEFDASKTKTFPIFINYDKQDNISDTTKYEDHFVAENRLIAISKSGRSMDSEDVQNFLNATERGIDVQLFVRKNKDDKISKEFYYLGRVIATGNAKQFVMPNTDKTAVEIEWELETPVREDIYQYIVNE